jgi:hypothetical protein
LKREISGSIVGSNFQINCDVVYSGFRMLVLPSYEFELCTSGDSFTKSFSLSSLKGNVILIRILPDTDRNKPGS